MRITDHFRVDEFASADGTPHPAVTDPAARVTLERLCLTLECIRAELGGRPVTITRHGGYRTPAVNRAVGGARNSRHVTGEAADFTVAGVSPRRVQATIRDLVARGRLPMLGGLGEYARFTHVDIRPRRITRWAGR